MKLDPKLKKFLGFGLIGAGALAMMSGVVNIVAAHQLIDQADAESLGVSRHEIVVTYAGFLVAGAVMVFFGWRMRK